MLTELCKKDSIWRDYALKICKDKNLADDLVQEMYLRRLDNDRGQQMTDYYIICTMKSIYLNMKSTNRLISVDDFKYIGKIEERFEPDDKEKKLLEKVNLLSFTKKELLELNYYHSLREIEEKYNINYGFVHRNIQDARKKVLGKNINQYKNKRLKHRIMKQSRGFGDTIEKITTGTGIKRVIKWIFGENCGCEERQEVFNKLFPYPAKCLTDEQKAEYQNFIDTRKIELEEKDGRTIITGTISKEEIKFITKLYAEVFSRKLWKVPCISCLGTVKQLNAMIYKLETVFANDVPIEAKPEPKKRNHKTKIKKHSLLNETINKNIMPENEEPEGPDLPPKKK